MIISLKKLANDSWPCVYDWLQTHDKQTTRDISIGTGLGFGYVNAIIYNYRYKLVETFELRHSKSVSLFSLKERI